jgi:hypothetical protein
MQCFIWYENNKGFRVVELNETDRWQDLATSMPDSVDVIELMNQSALLKKLSAIASKIHGVLDVQDCSERDDPVNIT